MAVRARWVRGAVAIAALVLAALAEPEVAAAEVLSPAISPSRIHVDEPVRQGSSVTLPGVSVTNRGGEPARYRMSVTPAGEIGGRQIDPTWVIVHPASFDLAGGQTRVVGVSLVIPANAPPSEYRARLRATVEPTIPDSGVAVTVRAAVASDLRFAVVEHHKRWFDTAWAWSQRYRWWVLGALTLYSSVVFGPVLRDRFEFSSPVRRRRRDDEG